MSKLLLPLASTLLALPVSAQDWPGWRGPAGDGRSACAELPTTWSRDEGVRWRVALPQPANGSPIVVGGKVLLTGAEDAEGKRRSLYCFDREDGERLWVRTVEFGRVMPTHRTNPYCGTTPASNGEVVVVWHASAGLHAYDLDGQPLWERDLGEFRHMWGYGTSPVIHGDRVVLNSGPGKAMFVAAFDLATGETLWRTDEPSLLTPEQVETKRLEGSWCTPLIVRHDERDLVICGQPTRVVAYDLGDGSIVWYCRGLSCERGDLVYSSPLVVGDVCLVMGGYVGPSIGVRLGGEGDVTETHRVWRLPEQKSNCGSGVAWKGRVYIPDMNGFVARIDPASGAVEWNERVGRGACWGSIVSAAGRLYLMNQDGTTVVFAPTDEGLGLLAENQLGEATNSTPAVSDGELFLRTHEHLYCIAAPEEGLRP